MFLSILKSLVIRKIHLATDDGSLHIQLALILSLVLRSLPSRLETTTYKTVMISFKSKSLTWVKLQILMLNSIIKENHMVRMLALFKVQFRSNKKWIQDAAELQLDELNFCLKNELLIRIKSVHIPKRSSVFSIALATRTSRNDWSSFIDGVS